MKALRLTELRELLQGAPFGAWWTEFTRGAAQAQEATARHLELLGQVELMDLRSELAQRTAMDAFSLAGEAEAAASRAAADAQELENRALALVGHYEEQRFRTSDLWYRLGGLERTVEETAEAAQKKLLERQREGLQREYAAEDQRRDKLWSEVEATWARSFERSLVSHEHADRSRRVRREAERLFREAEERRLRARGLHADLEASTRDQRTAEGQRAELLERAAKEFGCVSGDRFLYWRHPEDSRAAFAVALVDDAEGYNVDVKRLAVFTVGPQRGVAFLEPARDGLARTVEEGDRRFEEYLLGPRQGLRRSPGDGSPGGTAAP
jgi:hypothetical protein